MALTVYVNHDTDDLPLGTSGVDWIELSIGNDFLVFSNGTVGVVEDGQPIPSSFQLSQAGVRLESIEKIISLYLLADISDDELKEIHNMGNQNKRYVMAFDFDAATTSEPVLEAWDDSDLDSIDATVLGAGTPSNSWYRAITTTDGLPGTDWVGSNLAGSSDGHFLWLNNENGALASADTLYCNFKVVVPASQTAGGAESPVLVVKYTTT